MSNGLDPTAVLAALDCAQDAFEMVGQRSREGFDSSYKNIVRRQGDSLDWEYKGPVSE